MAEIASYQCTNLKCRFSMRVSREMPVWHPATPNGLRSLSPRPEARQYITALRSELFCHVCRKVIEHNGTMICVSCGAQDLREEQAGKSCAQCPIGVFEMTKLIVY
ncbi:hypothetical protein C4568_03850 [Candidatus Parcubacteria bacterium]|nr:MAG: hypothetical protein C4568_03850 [Candidatus Parcubacteria bacterium]